MYKIALIDDEDIVRNGMKELIHWQELGLTLVGDRADGETGLELIKDTSPDIILLDINMPKINGLELAKIVKEQYPKIKIIFITGYDEFSYAKQALKIGVEDYILKPVCKSEMIDILNNIVNKLDEERKKNKETDEMMSKVKQSIPLIQQKCIEDIVFEEMEESLLLRKCIQANIPTDKKAYGMILVDADHKIRGSKDEELTYFAIRNIMEEIVYSKDYGVLFELESINGILYYGEDDWEVLEETYLKIIKDIKVAIAHHIGITVTIGVGNLVEKITQVKNTYQSAKNALMSRFFLGQDKIISDRFQERTEKIEITKWMEWENKLIANIQVSNQMHRVIQDICSEMTDNRLSIENCHNIWDALATSMLKKFIQIDETITCLFNPSIQIGEEIREKKTLVEVRKVVEQLYEKCQAYIESQSSPNKIHLDHSIQFIQENYHRSDLSMKMVCDYVHLSPSYFSSILKKELGLTFVQVVTDYRMEKAKELLLYSSFRTYEIAEKVGFSDSHYFSSSFKKKFNKTPSEYRRNYTGKQDE